MVSEGYRPQATLYTKTLITTFAAGLVIGILIGWGAATSRSTPPPESSTPPPELVVRVEGAPEAETDTTTAEPPADSLPPIGPPPNTDSTAESAALVPGPPFAPDVEGLWPAEHLVVGIHGTTADVQTLEWLNEFKPGGVVLGPENVTDTLQLAALVLQVKQSVGLGTTLADPPLIYYQDTESNLPRILEDQATVRLVDSNSLAQVAGAIDQAIEGGKQGIAVVLGPTLDISSAGEPLPADITAEALEVRADAVLQVGLAYVEGLRAGGMLAAPGIFPGEGIAQGEGHARQIPAGDMDLLATAMQPFKTAINAGIPGIVVGHVAVPGIDKDQPNRPASISPKLLQLLLREDWAFSGVVLAGDVTRDPMVQDLPRDEIVLKALVNGCDAVILKDASRADLRKVCETFVRLSTRDDFPMDRIQASKERLAHWRELLERPPAPPIAPETVQTADARPPAEGEGPAAMPAPAVEDAPPIETATTAAPATEQPEPKAGDVPEAEDKKETPEEEDKATDTADKPVPESESPTPEPAAPGEEGAAPVMADMPDETEEVKPAAPSKDVITSTEEPAPEVSVVAESEMSKDAEGATATATNAAETDTAAPPAPEASAESTVDAPPVPEVPEDAVLVEHTIAKGESLTLIAKQYGVSLPDLRAWNALEDDNIKYGRKLKIYTSADNTLETVEITTASTPSEGDQAETAAPADPPEVVLAPDIAPPAEGSPKDAAAPALTLSEPAEVPVVSPAPVTPPPNTKKREHTVKTGETLESIADEYGVAMADILAWNGRTAEQLDLESGIVLAVYLPVAGEAFDATPEPEATPEAAVESATEPGIYETYEVKSGDNLRRIATRFGTTQKAIMELNGIDQADHVEIGWKLKIPKAAGTQAAPVGDAKESPATATENGASATTPESVAAPE